MGPLREHGFLLGTEAPWVMWGSTVPLTKRSQTNRAARPGSSYWSWSYTTWPLPWLEL